MALAGDHLQVLVDGYELTGDHNKVAIDDSGVTHRKIGELGETCPRILVRVYTYSVKF